MGYYFLGIIPYEMLLFYSVIILLITFCVIIVWYNYFYKQKSVQIERELLISCALNSAMDCIFIIDDQCKIILCNTEFSKFLCMDKARIIGKTLNDFMSENIANHLKEIEQRVRVTGGRLRFEANLVTLTGNSMTSEILISSCQNYNIVLYVIRNINEQDRIFNALVKRDKLLYALTCGTQKILDSSQDFDQALENALEEFCQGAEVDVVIMAQAVTAESCGYNVGHDASFYKIYNFWSESIEFEHFRNKVFEIQSANILFDKVIDQEKIVFIPIEHLVFFEDTLVDKSNIVGFYATLISCQGMKWGLLLLGCKEIKDKWDNETEDAIEITALQFGVLLERRKSEESINKTVTALKRSQSRLNMALEAAGAASFEYNLFFDKFDIDETLTEKLKYEAGWTISTLDDMKAIIHKSDLEKWHDNISALLNGDMDYIREDIRIRMSGGKYLWVAMIARTILENDVISGLSGVFQDIDDKMTTQTRLFNAEKMASIGELSTAIADNFNEASSDVLNNLSSLLESESNLTASEIKLVKNSISTIENSIDIAANFVALSSNHNRSFRLININNLIEDIIGMVRSDFSDSGIKIKQDLNPEIPDILCCSSDIMHVIINIMMNAKYAMLESQIKLLAIATTVDESSLIISILDTGCGISKSILDNIFTPFFTTKKKHDGGTGMGLSVSKLLINKYGGTIEVNSCEGQGAEFVIELPTVLTHEAIDDILPIDNED